MALRMGALYDALRAAPEIPEAAARAAAEEVAGYESQLAAVRSDLVLLKWMVTAVIALLIPILFKVFNR